MKLNANKLFVSVILILFFIYTEYDASAMEGQKEEDDNAYETHSSLPRPPAQEPLKGITLEEFTSCIRSNIDKEDIIGMITLTSGEVSKKLYFNYQATNSKKICSFQSDVSNLSTFESMAKSIPASVDLIMCGPRFFKRLYLGQQRPDLFLQQLGLMLKKDGSLLVAQKEKCPKSLIEEAESQPHPPQSKLHDAIDTNDILLFSEETHSPHPDYPLPEELSEKFLQSSNVTWETKKLFELLQPHVKETPEKLSQIAGGFGFSGAPFNSVLTNEESLRYHVALKIHYAKRKREEVKPGADNEEQRKRRRTEGDSPESYIVFNESDLYYVKSVLKKVFSTVYFYEEGKIISEPSQHDNHRVVATQLK